MRSYLKPFIPLIPVRLTEPADRWEAVMEMLHSPGWCVVFEQMSSVLDGAEQSLISETLDLPATQLERGKIAAFSSLFHGLNRICDEYKKSMEKEEVML